MEGCEAYRLVEWGVGGWCGQFSSRLREAVRFFLFSPLLDVEPTTVVLPLTCLRGILEIFRYDVAVGAVLVQAGSWQLAR